MEDLENPEKEPYKNKYKARKIYEELISTLRTTYKLELNSGHALLNQALAIATHLLACNFFECEENAEARKKFLETGKCFEKVPAENIPMFLNYLQELYNSLAVL